MRSVPNRYGLVVRKDDEEHDGDDGEAATDDALMLVIISEVEPTDRLHAEYVYLFEAVLHTILTFLFIKIKSPDSWFKIIFN